jgi:molybdate transport system substrate-binding protein
MTRAFAAASSCGALIAIFAVACGSGGTPDATPVPSSTAQALSGSITVFAAASLTDAFGEVASEFKKAHPGVEIAFNFAGSSALRTQLDQGARADVFASADTLQMSNARQSGVVSAEPAIFVRNSLVVITPKDNPGSVNAIADLKKPGLNLVLAAPEVPVGSYVRQMLTKADADPAFGAGFSAAVLENLVSNESNVKQVVAKVELGEADAGLVYATDVRAAAGSLDSVEIQGADAPARQATYLAAVTEAADGDGDGMANAWIDALLSRAGRRRLAAHGFALP